MGLSSNWVRPWCRKPGDEGSSPSGSTISLLLRVAMRRYVLFAMTRGLLFVYGTLMRGRSGHDQMKGARFLGEVRTAPQYNLKVLDDGTATGLVEGEKAVPGELYQVSYSQLEALDDWELDVYRREMIRLEDGRLADAFVFRT